MARLPVDSSDEEDEKNEIDSSDGGGSDDDDGDGGDGDSGSSSPPENDDDSDEEWDEEDEADDEEWEPEAPKAKQRTPSPGASQGRASGSAASKATGRSAGAGSGQGGKKKSGSSAEAATSAASASSAAKGRARGAKGAAAPPSGSQPPRDGVEVEASDALLRRAREVGLVSSDRDFAHEFALLHPSKGLRQVTTSRSLDVVKKAKGAASKPRYLLSLPGNLAPIDGIGGTIGSIERLDTPNPEIYIDWPGKGKLRLQGTLLYPRGRYLTLQSRAGQLLCDETFDNIIVFSSATWMRSTGGAPSVGRAAQSAEGDESADAQMAAAEDEGPLEPAPIPDAIHSRLHKKWSYAGGAATHRALAQPCH